nr:hypothetical protein [uncultured Cohaesibacter sp.]
MTTRKSNNRTEAKGKPVKTIDLTAEEVTKSEAPAAEKPSTEAEKTKSETEEAAKAEQDSAEADKASETTVASDGLDEKTPAKDPVDEEARSAVEDSAASDDETSADDTGIGESAAIEEVTGDKGSTDQGAGSGGDSGAPPASTPRPDEAPKSGGFGGGFVGGLLGGVAIIALGYVGLQQGWVSLPNVDARLEANTGKIDAVQSELASVKSSLSEIPTADLADVGARIEALETKLAALGGAGDGATASEEGASDEEAAPVDSNSPVGLQLEALAGRIDELKESVTAIDSLQTELLDAKAQLATLQSQTAEQGALIESKAAEQAAKLEADLQAARDDILSSADRRINDVVVDLTNFSEKMTTETSSLRERVTALEENNLSERMQSSARTIALAGLENAVASGANYELALKTFANVVGDHEAVAALQDYAATGAPTAQQLAAGFRARYDDILREAEGAGATTLLDKFLISAQSMVKVRSLNGEQKGDSLTSRLGVIEFHVKQGDLVKAAEEWDALPEAARTSKAGADWIEGLKARIAVNAAMDTIRAEFGTGVSDKAS